MKKILCLSLFNFLIAVNLTAQCWEKISAGGDHSIGLKTDGSLWVWGQNYYGEIGDSSNVNSAIPVQIGYETNWNKISGGTYHSVAIKDDGTLWAWGYNSNGQLGIGSITDSNIPVQIGNSSMWSQITCGGDHSLGLKTDGTLWAWGSNSMGQIGDATNTDKNIPTQIGNATDWNFVSASDWHHSMALKTDGTLWTWGYNSNGQLGNNASSNENSPIDLLCPTTGIQESKMDQVTIYPNPSHGKFIVSNSEQIIEAITIYSVFGERIFTSLPLHCSWITIDLSFQATGIYFVEIRGLNGLITKKIILY